MRHLITGGQQGSGLGIAKALAGAGFHVALASRSGADTPAVANAVRERQLSAVVQVSKSTVSLVLQGSPPGKAETRGQVQKAMLDIAHVYNRSAANDAAAATPLNWPEDGVHPAPEPRAAIELVIRASGALA